MIKSSSLLCFIYDEKWSKIYDENQSIIEFLVYTIFAEINKYWLFKRFRLKLLWQLILKHSRKNSTRVNCCLIESTNKHVKVKSQQFITTRSTAASQQIKALEAMHNRSLFSSLMQQFSRWQIQTIAFHAHENFQFITLWLVFSMFYFTTSDVCRASHWALYAWKIKVYFST